MELVTGYEVLNWKMYGDIYITILYSIDRDGTVPMKSQISKRWRDSH